MRHNFNEDREFTENMPLGEYFRKKRRILGMSQKDFGDMLGVDQHTISDWELGITSPPFEKAIKYVRQLGGEISIRNLVEGTPDMPFGYCPWQE